MMSYLARISQENRDFESRVNYEMQRSGHEFIVLVLTADKEPEFFEIGGIEVLQPIAYIEKNKTKYKFKKAGGSIKFSPDPLRGGYPVCRVLDTPENRKILATHYDLDYWQIEDQKTDQKIRELRTKIANKLKAETSEDDLKLQEELEELSNSIAGSDDLKEKTGLTNKMIKLISSHAKKKEVKAEIKRVNLPKPPKEYKLPQRNKKQVSEVVKVNEHK